MRVALTLVAVLSMACTDFDPRSLLNGPRVLGVVAAPPELSPTDTIELEVIEYAPDGPGTHTYTLCLVSIGVFGNFECADERLEIDLPDTGPTLSVDLGPDGVDLMGTLFEFISEVSAETTESDMECGVACTGRDGTSRDYIDVQITIESQWDGPETQTTVKVVRVHLAEAEPQTNPVLRDLVVTGLTDAGEVELGTTLEVSVDPSETSLETYVDSGGRTRTEELTFTWYSTLGTWDPPVTFGSASSSELTLPAESDGSTLDIFVVARDGRGGTAYMRQSLDIQSP